MPRGKTTTKVCNICGKAISLFAYSRHVKAHANLIKPKKTKVPKEKRTHCRFCNGEFIRPSSLGNHETRCKLNPNRKIEVQTEESRKKAYETKKRNGSLEYTEERKAILSVAMKKAVADNPDSYSKSNVSGRAKLYEIIDSNGKPTKVKGTWELKVANFLTENKIHWINDVEGIIYEWNGTRKYYPDFYCKDFDIFIEVKGYETERDHCKWKAVTNLVVFKAAEIRQIENNEFDIMTVLNKSL